MPRRKRERLTPGEQLTMAALWAAGPDATIGGLLEILERRGETTTYPSVQLHLRACVEKGWVSKRKVGRQTYFDATVEESVGIAEIFEEFATRFLEDRPEVNTQAIADRLGAVAFGGKIQPAQGTKGHAQPSKKLTDRVAANRKRLRILETKLTALSVEVQGLRAVTDKAPQRRRARGGKAS